MKVIIYELDGDLCRITPVNGFTAEDVIKDVPPGVNYKIVENDSLPDARKRHQWKLEGDQVVLDATKIDVNTEESWVEAELALVRDKIEEKEDAGLKAPKLRAYRVALKQYKSDLYMPNVSRPTL